jgi:hypothetical protein
MGKTRKTKIRLEDFTTCHPGVSRTQKKKGRCLPDDVYRDLSKKLRVSPTKLFERVGCKQGEEHCLVDKAPFQDKKKKTLRKQYLRTRQPKSWEKDPDQWLNNENISAVMKQYEEALPWFKFMGVYPIDFSAPNPYKQDGQNQCLYKELCTINLKKMYRKGIRGIGIVFNLDNHLDSGSHWVAMYINLEDIHKPFIGYFDSTADDTPELIARLMRSFTLEIPMCKLACNARQFQFGNTECGMFSLYFLVCMIRGIPFQDFCKDSVNDKYMLTLRNILFTK